MASTYERFESDTEKSTSSDAEPPACCSECLSQYKDPVEFLSLLSLIALSVGILLTMVGYLVPRQYEFDGDLPAEEMEVIEMYYDQLSWRLDVCIIVGMGFVVSGGIILAGIIMYLHVTSDFWAALCGEEPEPEWSPGASLVSAGAGGAAGGVAGPGSKIRKHVPGYQSTGESEKLRAASMTSEPGDNRGS
jgi:hypothetical protein